MKKHINIYFFIIHIFLFLIIYSYTLYIGYIFDSKFIAFIFVFGLAILNLLLSIIVKRKCQNIPEKQIISVKILSVFMALFLIYSFDIYKQNIQPSVNIEIKAENQRSEESLGSNIEIINIKLDNKIIQPAEMEIKGGYELKKPAYDIRNVERIIELTPEENNPSVIKIKGKGNNVYVAIASNEESGIAQVKINNQNYYINAFMSGVQKDFVFSNGIKLYTYPVSNNLSVYRLIFKYLYVLSYFLLFFMMILNISKLVLNINIEEERKYKFSNLSFIIYSLPILIVSGFYLLAFYPAIMPFDSLTQWKYATLGIYGVEHPLVHTYIIHILQKIYNSPLTVSITQILICAGFTGYFFSKFEKYNIPRIALLLCSFIIAFIPYNSLMSVTLWKDVLYSYGVFGLTLLTILMYFQKNSFFKSKWNIIFMLLQIMLIVFSRYNGIYFIPVYFLFLFIIFKNYRKKFFSVFLGIIIIYILAFIKVHSFPLIDYKFIYNQTIEVPIYQVQSVIVHKGKISETNLNKLNEIVPLYKWESGFTKYCSHNFIFATPELRDKKINKVNFIKIYFPVLKDNFILMIREHIQLNAFLLKYKANPEGISRLQNNSYTIENDNPLAIKSNVADYNLKQKSKIPQLKLFIEKLDNKCPYILYYPYIYLYMFLLFGALFIIKNGYKYICILLPSILSVLSIMISLPEMCSRYVFYLFLLFPVIILLSIIKVYKEE